jgi:hypothetical protein
MKALKTALLVVLISILALCFALVVACTCGDDDDGGDDDGDYPSCGEACDHAVNCFSSSVNDALKSKSNEPIQILPCVQDGSCFAAANIGSLPDDAIHEENGKCLEWCQANADLHETDCIIYSSCGEISDDITQCGTMSEFVHGMIERNGIVVE